MKSAGDDSRSESGDDCTLLNLNLEDLQLATSALSAAMTLNEVNQIILDYSPKTLGADAIALYLYDENSKQLVRTARNGLNENLAAQIDRLKLTGNLPLHAAFRSANPIFIDDPEEIAREFPVLSELKQEHSPFAALPLLASNNVIGVLTFVYFRPVQFNPTIKTFAFMLAGQCAQAIQRALLFEREREARAHAESERTKLYSILDHLPAAIAIVQSPDYRLTYVNHGYELTTRQARQDLLGKPLLEAHPELRGQPIIQITDHVLSSQTPFIGEQMVEILDSAGTMQKQYRTGVLMPLKELDPNTKSILSYSYDVTDIRRGQEEMKAAKEEAEAANKSKTAFVANMSHEFRTPLSAILGFIEFLAKDDLPKDKRLSYIDGVRRNGHALLKLVEDILDLAKVEAGSVSIEPQSFNPRTLIRDVVDVFAPESTRKNVEIKVELSDQLPDRFVSDPVRLRQVLINLVGNALKFTESGEVVIQVHQELRDQHHPHLHFKVIDTGIGLAPEEKERLFQPFAQADQSTRRRFGGTGLGLYISNYLAKVLNGELYLESTREGEGSCFVLRIAPLEAASCAIPAVVRGTADQSTVIKPPGLDPAVQGFHLLVAEDTEDIRDLLRDELSSLGFRITVAANGNEAIDLVLRSELEPSEAFDAVLMDLHMPKMDGFAATELLRAKGFQKPILAFTALTQSEDRVRCYEIGFDSYLTKPLRVRELVATLKRLVRKQ